MKKDKREVKNTSRRKLLKKAARAAVFVVPTVLTFKVTDLHAQASSTPTTPGW
ncbi:MAG: hypothetical protein WCU00_12975 [Candidatus Latescibacterota bacterium]